MPRTRPAYPDEFREEAAAMDAQLLGRRLYETMLVWDTEEFSDPVMVEFAEIWRPLENIARIKNLII